MKYFKKLLNVGSRNIMASLMSSAIWMLVLFIGSRLATYYAYHYHGYTNLTPTSTDKFFPVMLVVGIYMGLNTVWLLETINDRYGSKFKAAESVVGRVFGIIFKVFMGILKVVFFPIIWWRKFWKEDRPEIREMFREEQKIRQDERDIKEAAAIQARKIIERHKNGE